MKHLIVYCQFSYLHTDGRKDREKTSFFSHLRGCLLFAME